MSSTYCHTTLGIRCVGLKDVGGKRVYQAKRVSRSKQAGEVGEGQVSEEMENQIEG